ncbi:MAG: thiol:disulfide interchange protein DsbA/DsbL [Gammaproteobacteria bacterium]|nr:thiol:disulfide interchange protein DsbA/DsbL [Gammaproteobacteria bacterium]MCY4282245.1 thiol:disulfide interchange protein DsbA/DsbL [Gammaproteobacteria bacterium]MCY4337458.1 thiol:disulfide interchange protein DsbA/DsbL [Gammaproteobacteria bacterium]
MRVVRLLIPFLLWAAVFPALAQDHSHDHHGPAYTPIKPALPTSSGDKIEVAEIFWYGCSHCFSFEPHVKSWLETKPEDVEFRLVPGVLNNRWAIHARGYFAADKMGALEQFHTPLFNALHVKRRNIFTRAALIDFAAEVGLDKKEFVRHYDSNETEVKMKQAFLMARDAKITGVPAVIVNGKYLISASSAGSHEGIIKTMDELIQQERRR